MAERRGINEGVSSEFEGSSLLTFRDEVSSEYDGSSLLTFGKNDSARPATPKIEEVKAGKGSLSLVQFIAVLYFLCCGGPYGIEVAVKTGFPAIVFLMIFLVPFVWILPVGLVTCELGTTMPDNEGFIRWINAAWGPSLAFTASVTYMVQLTCDNALYPILFAQYIASAMTPYPWYSDWMSVALRFLCILVAMVLNFFGVDVVGNYSSVFTFLTLSPFLVMVVWTGILGEVEPSDWIEFPPGLVTDQQNLVNISLCFNVIIWCYSGIEATGNLVEEIKQPNKNLLPALLLAILTAILTYSVCVTAALGVDTHYTDWKEGYFTVLATKLGGLWFGIVMTCGAGISCFATYNALLCATSQILAVMSPENLLNVKILGWTHRRFHTPWVAISLETVLVAGIGFLPFQQLVVVNNVLYSLVLLMILSAAIKLRISSPNLERPFRISSSRTRTVLFTAPPVLVCLFLLITGVIHDPYKSGAGACFPVLCFCFFHARRWFRSKRTGVERTTPEIRPLLLSQSDSES